MLATCYTLNRTGQSTVKEFTPQQLYERELGISDEKTNNAGLRIIGSKCFAFIDENHRVRSEKLEAKGAKALFLGYEGDHIYRLVDRRRSYSTHSTYNIL